MSFIPPPNEANDIFSLSDQALSERYQFVEEVGFRDSHRVVESPSHFSTLDWFRELGQCVALPPQGR